MSTTPDPYQPVRASLEILEEHFKRAAAKYPPLLHDMIASWPEGDRHVMKAEGLRKFLNAQPASDGDWQEWHGPHEYIFTGQWINQTTSPPSHHDFEDDWYWCGRFYGSQAGVAEFKQLAHSLYLAISQTDKHLPGRGWPGMVLTFHLIAQTTPTPSIRTTKGVWGWADEHEDYPEAAPASYEDSSEFIEKTKQHMLNEWDDRQFAPHPPKFSFKTSIFEVALAFIHSMQRDESLFDGLKAALQDEMRNVHIALGDIDGNVAEIGLTLRETSPRIVNIEKMIDRSTQPPVETKAKDRIVVDATSNTIVVDGTVFVLNTDRQAEVLKILHSHAPGWIGQYGFQQHGFRQRHDKIIKAILKDHPALQQYIKSGKRGFRLIAK